MPETCLPLEMRQFRLPESVHSRLTDLLDKQDRGEELTAKERAEADGLVTLAEFLSLLKLRSERAVS